MFGIGLPELMVILVVALLVFGPAKLPELARSLGRGLAEFRRASLDLRTSIMEADDAAKEAVNEVKDVAAADRSAAERVKALADQPDEPAEDDSPEDDAEAEDGDEGSVSPEGEAVAPGAPEPRG